MEDLKNFGKIFIALIKVEKLNGFLIFVKLIVVIAVNSTCKAFRLSYRIPTPTPEEFEKIVAEVEAKFKTE